ncbi:sensor histidine kinase [Marivirga sp.]|uniref:sensor histidine kinase n=1 Tax=Marivirga sp. TaxID=2018662 RepID=UPI003DA77F74
MDIKGSFRLFSIFSLGLLCLIFYFLIYNYFSGLEDSKESTLKKLKAIVCTAAIGIDGNLHNEISMRYGNRNAIQSTMEDSSYYQIHQQIKEVQEVNDLESPIYTMIYDSINSEFQFIVSSSETPYFRHQYKRYPQKLLEDFRTGGILDVYESENGVWLSAFAPITDEQDQVVGLVQVDEDFSSFLATQQKELIINSIISILLIAPFIVFFFLYLKKRVHQEEQFKEKIYLQNNEITRVNDELVLKNQELDKTKNEIEIKNIELDSRVRQRTRELLKLNIELRNLLYRTSHDIMGPLATLQGLCNLGKIEFDNKEFSDFLSRISNTTGDLIIRIKGISKIYDAKNSEVVCKSVAPASLLSQIADSINSDLPEQNINWIIEVPEDLLINTDAELFSLSFHELLYLILKNNLDADYLKIKYSSNDKGLHCFQIEANGHWLDKERKEEFKKLFKSSVNHLEGQGLRLYLAKSAIKKLNGTISLSKDLKNGVLLNIKINTGKE